MTRQIGDARTDEPHLARTKHLHNVCDMCLTTRRARTLNILCCKFLVSAFFNLPYRNLDPQNIGETCSRNLRHDKLATRSIYIQRILRAICRPSLMPPLLTRAQHLGPLLCWPHHSLPSLICGHSRSSKSIFPNSTTAQMGNGVTGSNPVTPPVVNYRTLGRGKGWVGERGRGNIIWTSFGFTSLLSKEESPLCLLVRTFCLSLSLLSSRFARIVDISLAII